MDLRSLLAASANDFLGAEQYKKLIIFASLMNGTLWWTYKKLLNMAIEIVDFPIKNGDFPLLC